MKRIVLLIVGAALLLLALLAMSSRGTSARTPGYAPYTGTWSIHGYQLRVTAGRADAIYRTYTWCGPRRRYGCDRIVGNEIFEGGIWTAPLSNPNATQVSGTIEAAADSSLLGAAITLQPRPHDFLRLTWRIDGQTHGLTLCGPNVPSSMSGRCGA